MKKKILIAFSLLAFMTLLLTLRKIHYQSSDTQVIASHTPEKTTLTSSETHIEENSSQQLKRRPAQESHSVRKQKFKKDIRLENLELDYQLDESIFIVKNITAVSKHKFDSSMGEILYEDPIFNYILSEKDFSHPSLAIYDARNKSISSISHIIKIRNADEIKRDEIISRGFRENLYLEKLQLLFIETSTNDFSAIYESLKSQGFGPEYQVRDRQYFPK